MNRTDMIQYIQLWYGNWERLHSLVVMEQARKVGVWFVSFDGPNPSDMYLCSKDPRGDNEGELITCSDCFTINNSVPHHIFPLTHSCNLINLSRVSVAIRPCSVATSAAVSAPT